MVLITTLVVGERHTWQTSVRKMAVDCQWPSKTASETCVKTSKFSILLITFKSIELKGLLYLKTKKKDPKFYRIK